MEIIMKYLSLLAMISFLLISFEGCKKEDNNPVSPTSTNAETYQFDVTIPWQQSKDAAGVNITALGIISDAAGNSHVLAGSWTGVFSSTDDGASWRVSTTGLGDTAISSFAIQGATVYAGTERKGVFKSTDFGINWVSSNNGITTANVTDLLITKTGYLFASTNGNGVYTSTDNGNNWSSVSSGLTSQTVYNIISNIDGTNIFAGTFGEGVFLSTNNGASWTQVNNGLASLTVDALGMSNDGTSSLFAGTYSCIFRSTDKGSNWVALNNGLSNTLICAIVAADTCIFVATAGGGVYLSTNKGANWSAVNNGLPTNYVFCLAISKNKSGGHTLFAGTGNGIWKHPI
jgi:photosystem II stability/assembly factor-like uncharacterized protein